MAIIQINDFKMCTGSRNGERYNRIKDADQICDALEKLGNVFMPVPMKMGENINASRFCFDKLFEDGDIISFPKDYKEIKTSFEMEDKKVEFVGTLVNVSRGELNFQRLFYPIYIAERYIYCEVFPLMSYDEDGNEIELNDYEVADEYLKPNGSATIWYESLRERSDKEVIEILCSDNKKIKVSVDYENINDWQSDRVMSKRVYRFDFI